MPRRAHPPCRRRRQRGAALLTAMIIVTLVATLAAAMVWQQWRAVQVESAERARVQAAWILSGALDFARLILREDQKSRNGQQFTALTEPWATPLAEARLSTFLATDKSNADDGPEAFLSGSIVDAQSRYNLTNLLKPATGTTPAAVDPAELESLVRLCQSIGVESGVAVRIAAGLRDAIGTPTGTAPLRPQTVSQLRWLGIDAASVEALRPYVVLLPAVTPINVNTASKEVLAASIKGMDAASAERLVQLRQRAPFKDRGAFDKQVEAFAPLTARLGVRSDYFEVRSRLRLLDRVLVDRTLVQRRPDGQVNVLERERLAGLDQAGG